MERHAKAIGIKFIIVSIVIFSLFGIFYNVSLAKLFMMSVIVTGVAYVLGDLFMYPRFGNFLATLSDFALAFGSVWVLSYALIGMSMPLTLASLAAAYFIATTEPLFHTYMKEKVLQIEEDPEYRPARVPSELQTEFAKDMDAKTIRKTKNISDNRQTDVDKD